MHTMCDAFLKVWSFATRSTCLNLNKLKFICFPDTSKARLKSKSSIIPIAYFARGRSGAQLYKSLLMRGGS